MTDPIVTGKAPPRRAKLDKALVARIKARLVERCPCCDRVQSAKEIAHEFGVNASIVYQIRTGHMYWRVEPAPSAWPSPTRDEIVARVVKRYPHGGNQLCAAIGLAVDLALASRAVPA